MWRTKVRAGLREGNTDRQPGVQLVLKERVPRFPPKCATDLIKLTWEQACDWAVLVSSDTDFIPVAVGQG
jgi:uncharacterized LabA/DUF88 family protein